MSGSNLVYVKVINSQLEYIQSLLFILCGCCLHWVWRPVHVAYFEKDLSERSQQAGVHLKTPAHRCRKGFLNID